MYVGWVSVYRQLRHKNKQITAVPSIKFLAQCVSDTWKGCIEHIQNLVRLSM